MREFKIPFFLENKSANDIFESMKLELPDDIDISEGSHEWNMTRPTALEVARICQFILPEVVKLIFPDWSYGEYLDAHGRRSNILRRAATAARGVLTITGAPNTDIPAGSLFSTASVNESPTTDYATVETVKIPVGGVVDVEVACTKTGAVGNTAKETVIVVSSKLTGITSVINKEEIVGGTDTESDESLRLRINEYDATQGQSFVGNVSDYKRWATSVDGIGEATIVPPAEDDDSGTITIILTDANGAPANSSLIKAVNDYIMRPDEPRQRLAPPNARLNIVAPTTVVIAIKATVELVDGYTVESVKKALVTNMSKYLPQAMDEKEIKYTRVARVLSDTAGVNDYSGLQIGKKQSTGGVMFGTSNIPVAINELPTIVIDNLTITSGTV